jgi:hypothetical protein
MIRREKMVQKNRWMFAAVVLMGLSLATPLKAEELAKIDPVPVSTEAAGNDYLLCAFYPKPGTCEGVYRHAMDDSSITAQAVRAEYSGYVRYLDGAQDLTDADRRYLAENNILMPAGLDARDQAGLHNVIAAPGLTAQQRLVAVNDFLSRAVQAELYCGFHDCGPPAQTMAEKRPESMAQNGRSEAGGT